MAAVFTHFLTQKYTPLRTQCGPLKMVQFRYWFRFRIVLVYNGLIITRAGPQRPAAAIFLDLGLNGTHFGSLLEANPDF